MNKLFIEFENENSLRTYPFASGCVVTDTDGCNIGTGVLIDAALYPVNPKGNLYLSSIRSSGIVEISDDSGVIMTSVVEHGSRILEFYETSGLKRHVGTVLTSGSDELSSIVNSSKDRVFTEESSTFASSCVFAIENDGILSLNIGKTGVVDGAVSFSNSDTDDIRVSTNGTNLRFDVLPFSTASIYDSIQHIYCVVDGKTPFRIMKLPIDMATAGAPGNVISVYLDNIERSDVCNNAHRENSLEMVDTCDCGPGPEPPEHKEIPHVYQVEVVDIPNGADSAFYLTVPNFTGYDNPLSITMEDGVVAPNTEIEAHPDINQAHVDIKEITDSITSNGVVLQVPGLAASI